MIDLPFGKALIAVDSGIKCNGICETDDYQCKINCCDGCWLDCITLKGLDSGEVCESLCCIPHERKDGKNVFHKLVDYPVTNKSKKKKGKRKKKRKSKKIIVIS